VRARLLKRLDFRPHGGSVYAYGEVVDLKMQANGYGRIDGRWWIRPEDYLPHLDMELLNEWAYALEKEDPR
jgi:hypothetical protein